MNQRARIAVIIAFFAALPASAESFKSWAARGAREQRENDPKAAASSYSNALSMWTEEDGDAGKAKVLCARSAIREKDGDDAGALKDLSDCLEIDKKNAKGFHRRGTLLFKAGKTAAAIGDYYKAVALDIRFAQAYADRAAAYERQGERAFAREDYKHACSFGLKPACAKAKELAPGAAKAAAKPKPAPPAPKPAAVKAPQAAPPKAPEAEPGAPVEIVRAPKAEAAAPEQTPAYSPRYKDCLTSLDRCVEGGNSFGACVRAAPDCAVKTVKGCCPAACLKAYQKAINGDRSEAQAYREHFAAGAACGVPPKIVEEE